MRTVILSAVAAAIWLLAAGTASAQNYYAGVHGGLNITHDGEIANFDISYDPGLAVGGVFGYRLNPNVRFDAEITYRENDVDEFAGGPVPGDVSSLAFLVNAYYDIPIGSNLIPYVGGGLGAALVELDDSVFSDEDGVFAFQVGAGLGYAISPTTTLSLDYRFFGTQKPEFFGAKYDYLNSTLLVGARFDF